VAVGGGPEDRGGREQAPVVGVLVAKLDQIDAAGEGGFEQRREGLAAAAALSDEVEPRSLELAGRLRHREQA